LFMVGNALFFGKDRLVDVEQEILRAQAQSA
jgi:2-hydroxychromene-2-carboxylate isomerase